MLRSVQDRRESLHNDLGWKRLNPWWAKAEILAGLVVAGVGIAMLAEPIEWWSKIAGVFVFVLGSYLAMAGHRSHLYQSNNILAAWLAQVAKEQNGQRDNA